MYNCGVFRGKTVFISGGSSGIGKAIALKLAKDGANIAVIAKSVSIFMAAQEIEAIGGKCLPIQCDVRNEFGIKDAIDRTVKQFGGLDVVVNNAGVHSMTDTEQTLINNFDTLLDVNMRSTFITPKYAIPHLKKSSNPHILNISPPLVKETNSCKYQGPFTITKYGATTCAILLAEELRCFGIAVNTLWPRTAIWTATMSQMSGGREETALLCRKTDIMADSVYGILSKNSHTFTANTMIDEDFLLSEGVKDMTQYSVQPGNALLLNYLIPDHEFKKKKNLSIPS